MKINRNDACPCGSGKKYKHCCNQKMFSGEDGKKTIRTLIIGLIASLVLLTAYSVYQFYQEDRPKMETYLCDNPQCNRIHYRPVPQNDTQ